MAGFDSPTGGWFSLPADRRKKKPAYFQKPSWCNKALMGKIAKLPEPLIRLIAAGEVAH
jgi:hypothetical protein